MAQDFLAAFGHDGVGTIGTDTTITSTDMDGILMIAAQALEKRTLKQAEEIDALRAESTELKARLDALERNQQVRSEVNGTMTLSKQELSIKMFPDVLLPARYFTK